ncbi:MAG: sulfotransferase [Phycisphaerales bacterium]|nr:MAG: sulfotransferase [Phycisphaerales bacterium]
MSFLFNPDKALHALRDEQPVLLMGRGHSGTRVLAYAVQMLGVDLGFTKNTGTGDPIDKRFRGELARAARGWDVGDDPPLEDMRRLAKIIQRWRTKNIKGSPWGWKYPECYLLIAHLNHIFPRAKYIHIIRDGRDLAFKHHRTSDPSTTLGRLLLTRIDAMHEPPHVQAARSWAYQVNLFNEYAARMIPRERRFETRFEDLCRDPVGETERIASFLGLKMDDETREFLTGHIKPEKISQHRDEQRGAIEDVEQAIGGTLRQLGYEPGRTRTEAGQPAASPKA